MKADPEQRAVQLGEYIAAHNATVRAAAAAFGCSKSTVHKDVAVRLRSISRRCTGRCAPCWPATRPSATCGAGLPPGADTAAAEAQKRPLHCAAVFFAERVFKRLLSSPGVKLL